MTQETPTVVVTMTYNRKKCLKAFQLADSKKSDSGDDDDVKRKML
jgi:hypothetical protein